MLSLVPDLATQQICQEAKHKKTTGVSSALKLSAPILVPTMSGIVLQWKCSFLLAELLGFHLTVPGDSALQHWTL